MLIDLTCPVEVVNVEILSDDRKRARSYIKLHNISQHNIIALNGTMSWLCENEKCISQSEFNWDTISIHPNGFHTSVVPSDGISSACKLQFQLSQVQFSNAKPWENGQIPPIEYDEKLESPGKARAMLMQVAGHDAVRYPALASSYWACVCGRPNLPSEHTCVRCYRKKEQVFQAYTKPAVVEKYAMIHAASARLAKQEKQVRQSEEARAKSAAAKLQKHRAQRLQFIHKFMTFSAMLLVVIVLAAVMRFIIGSTTPTPEDFVPPKKNTGIAVSMFDD